MPDNPLDDITGVFTDPKTRLWAWGGVAVVAGLALYARYASANNGAESPANPPSGPGNQPVGGGGSYPYTGIGTVDEFENFRKRTELEQRIFTEKTDLAFLDAVRRGKASIEVLELQNRENERAAQSASNLSLFVNRAERTAYEADRETDYNFLFSPAVSVTGGNTGGGLSNPIPAALTGRDREGSRALTSTGGSTTRAVFVPGVGMVPRDSPQAVGRYGPVYRETGGGYGQTGTGSSGNLPQGFGDDAAVRYGSIRTVGVEAARNAWFTPTIKTRSDAIYYAANRGSVDAFNQNLLRTGYQTDTTEYLNRRAGQETRDTARENKPKSSGFNISIPGVGSIGWGNSSGGGGGGYNGGGYSQPDYRNRQPTFQIGSPEGWPIRTPTTFPRNSGGGGGGTAPTTTPVYTGWPYGNG